MGFFTMVLGYLLGIAKVRTLNILGDRNFSRDNLSELTGWGARLERSLSNLFESLPAFTIVVLVAHVTHVSNGMSELGAQLFVGSRILHPIFYITGLFPLRSLSYLVGTTGIIMIALQL